MAAGDRIAMALASDIAPLFDTSATYLVGSYVIYGNGLYRCTTEHQGAWDASHFTAVNVGSALRTLNLKVYPFIIEQPEDSETPIGGTAVFLVESMTATSYQWQEKSPSGYWVNSTDSGATTGNLMVPITAQNVRGYKWRCRLKNADGKTVFTNAVTNNPKYDLAPTFDPTENYAVGAYVLYAGVLYRCTTAHTGAWDASHFEAVSVGGDIVNYLPTLFAPAGFGLGTGGKQLTASDKLDHTFQYRGNFGLYWSSAGNVQDPPEAGKACLVLCLPYSSAGGVLIGISTGSTASKPGLYTKHLYGNTSSQWYQITY